MSRTPPGSAPQARPDARITAVSPIARWSRSPQGQELLRWGRYAGAAAGLALLASAMFWWALGGAIHNRKVQIVPDLKEKSLSAAIDMLSPLNLALRKEGSEFNDSVPIGTILRQRPPAGTKVREGKILQVVLSQGGQTVFVPNLVGLPLRNAEMMLRQSQLLLGDVTESYSLRMEKGMVLSQNPKGEASLARGSLIHVAISGGAPPSGIVLMPDFLRKDMAEATSWASQASVELAVEKDPSSLFPYGVVLDQDPPADSVLGPAMKARVTISARSQSGPQAAHKSVHYEVPQGSSDNHVRILLVDADGERELFNGLRPPGSKVDLDIPVMPNGRARMKVYLNGILVEERNL